MILASHGLATGLMLAALHRAVMNAQLIIAGMLINRIKYPEHSISIVGYADTRPKKKYTDWVKLHILPESEKRKKELLQEHATAAN